MPIGNASSINGNSGDLTAILQAESVLENTHQNNTTRRAQKKFSFNEIGEEEMEFINSIIGYKAIKLELSRILDQLVSPEKYAVLGVTEPHGLLLHGVPGVGKAPWHVPG